jgi:hypothetical protein
VSLISGLSPNPVWLCEFFKKRAILALPEFVKGFSGFEQRRNTVNNTKDKTTTASFLFILSAPYNRSIGNLNKKLIPCYNIYICNPGAAVTQVTILEKIKKGRLIPAALSLPNRTTDLNQPFISSSSLPFVS